MSIDFNEAMSEPTSPPQAFLSQRQMTARRMAGLDDPQAGMGMGMGAPVGAPNGIGQQPNTAPDFFAGQMPQAAPVQGLGSIFGQRQQARPAAQPGVNPQGSYGQQLGAALLSGMNNYNKARMVPDTAGMDALVNRIQATP